MTSVVAIGEMMIELSEVTDDAYARIGVGGDTGNTAVYLRRLFQTDGQVSYLTRLGQGAFSDRIADFLASEKVMLSPTARVLPGVPGLYAIATDDEGERTFTYWRSAAAVRELLSGDAAQDEIAFAKQHDALYISGISLAVLSDEGRQNLTELADWFLEQGREVMYDVNHRPHLWASHSPDVDIAEANIQMFKRSSIVKIGRDEGEAIFGIDETDKVATFVCEKGAKGVVVTDGPGRLAVNFADQLEFVTFDEVTSVVDSTAAGDSFSAGFLHAFLTGQNPAECAASGQKLAGTVIQFPGAVIPMDEMPI